MSMLEENLNNAGFALVREAAGSADRLILRAAAEELAVKFPAEAHGLRHLLARSPAIRQWVESGRLRGLIPAGYAVVRSILFDKNPAANWNVSWHQDLTVALRERIETEGFGPWTIKEKVVHAQAPMALLERMVTVRLHLDRADRDNGALHVLSGSHAFGKIPESALDAQRQECEEITCEAAAGDALLMRPLLLHSSQKSVAPRHRRVIHLECAPAGALPEPLQWAERVEIHPA